ncbi:caffeic acid 3-O-methyltransferase 2-like [Cryptomeria japonica]|uniref:caffeic acid 3-O-methyltransferase 2-like n=1 Tax=Cryptomeria japonica TaxID=3369 RepID=UPI0027DAAF0A|nr:caffeic acid 3-O-methyltransferase 2-like [Cryptomeria japonica]
MEEAKLKLYDMMISLAKPMALRSVALLNIPDIMATHGQETHYLSVEEIASHMSPPPANLEILCRILRFLASHGVFAESGDRFGLNDVSKLLVQKGNEESLAPYLLFVSGKVAVGPWQHLDAAVVENCNPFEKEYGMSSWEYASKNPKSAMTFHRGMASYANSVMPYVVEKHKGFEDIKSLVDVGGGVGASLHSIVSKYPHIHGINFDLPHVVSNAPPIPGVEHVGGSMFEGIPTADAVFLKWVLHNWDDKHCVTLLKKCYDAIPENGKVIIVETIVESQGSLMRPLQLSFDMSMIFCNGGAKERTEEEFKSLFKDSGFKCYIITKLPLLESIIELSKFLSIDLTHFPISNVHYKLYIFNF